MSTTRRGAYLVGIAAAALAVTLVITGVVVDRIRGDDRLHIVLHTEQIGDGVVAGTNVRLDGIEIGTVDDIAPSAGGRQLITLALDRSQLFGLDDSLTVDYAPANLFGITELDLTRGAGGAPLHEGAVIDLPDATGKVNDATMGALMRSLTQTTTGVLTPKFAEVLSKIATDLRAFTPLLEAIITTSRTIADTRFLPPSVVLGGYGDALSGGASIVDGSIQLLDRFNNIEVLRTGRARFDTGVSVISEKVLPALGDLLFAAQPHVNGYTDMLAPLLGLAAQMVPTPQRPSAEITELLARLDAAFVASPAGPVLNLDVVLRGVPALAVPLLGPTGLVQGGPR